eukprot:m.90743 g.90743  ORF g.90743 m.90743 type:complete len:716 (-) comp11880_c0_seq3:548-2695(-)
MLTSWHVFAVPTILVAITAWYLQAHRATESLPALSVARTSEPVAFEAANNGVKHTTQRNTHVNLPGTNPSLDVPDDKGQAGQLPTGEETAIAVRNRLDMIKRFDIAPNTIDEVVGLWPSQQDASVSSLRRQQLPSYAYAARMAVTLDERRKGNQGWWPKKLPKGEACGEGESGVLCVLSTLFLTWRSREARELGCALNVAISFEKGMDDDDRLDPLSFFRKQGWCQSVGKTTCDLVEEAWQTFNSMQYNVGIHLEKAVDTVEDDEPTRSPPLGAMCIRYSGGYTLQLALTLMNAIDHFSLNLSEELREALNRIHENVHRAVYEMVELKEDSTAVSDTWRQIEELVGDHTILTVAKFAATTNTPPLSGSVVLKRPSLVSHRALLSRQRARFSSGPLSGTSTIKLSSGNTMPIVGFGTGYANCFDSHKGTRQWLDPAEFEMSPVLTKETGKECAYPSVDFVALAISKLGFRMVDTAPIYGSEQRVFAGVRKAVASGISRSDIFVMTKSWPEKMISDGVEKHLMGGIRAVALQERLRTGKMDYVDAYVEHHALESDDPMYNSTTWESFLQVLASGLSRSVGVSGEVKPSAAIVQVRLHPTSSNDMIDGLLDYLDHNVTLVNVDVATAARFNPLMQGLGMLHSKSAVQYAIRWSLQMGIPVLVKSRQSERLRENIAVFDFSLSDFELDMIDTMISCNPDKYFTAWFERWAQGAASQRTR